MKFLSIDTETTGLDESFCQVLEIAVVIGDLTRSPVDELPAWNARLYYDRVVGEPYALWLNARLICDMERRPDSPSYMYMHPDTVWSALNIWLDQQHCHLDRKNKMTVAGKNYGSFDRRFLVKLPRWQPEFFHQRVIDPGNLFWRPGVDEVLPDTKECIRRAGIEWDEKRFHSAVEDARLVVELVRAGSSNLRK